MILYGVANCPGCDVALRWLDNNKVKFEYVNLDDDYEAKVAVVAAGIRSVPAMHLDGKIMSFEDAKAYLEARFGNG